MSEAPVLPDLRDLEPAGLEDWLRERGEERYRADQLLDALYRHPVSAIAEIKALPQPLREKLGREFRLALPLEVNRLVSADGAVKLLLRLDDGERVEAVWIPEPGRATLCLSTQVGCRMACRFCRTGQGGFRRQLTPAEIVGQAIVASRAFGRLTNLVFMGMGEPLDNLDHVLAALRILTHKRGLALSPRRLTVSTIGLPEGIRRLADLGPPVGLALSLHSAVAATRARLMPAVRAYDLGEVKEALGFYAQTTGRKVTLEVTLIAGENDSAAEARAVARFAAATGAKVNLIAMNPAPESELGPPPAETIAAYHETLRQKEVDVFLRRGRGADILAACGQLRAEKET